MTALLLQFWPYILAGIAALAALFKYRSGIIKAERAKQDRARIEAMTEAQKIDEAIAGRDPDENRKEFGTWGG